MVWKANPPVESDKESGMTSWIMKEQVRPSKSKRRYDLPNRNGLAEKLKC